MKKISLVSFLFITSSVAVHAMKIPQSNTEKSLLDMEKKYYTLSQLPAYKDYMKAKEIHEKKNTPETFALMEEIAAKVLETQEFKEFNEMAQRKAEVNHNQEFSDYALQKHQAMQNSAEFMQYEKAKQAHQIYNTLDTAYMDEYCKKELRNTKECQEWLGAVEQEKQVIKNIQQSTTKH